MSGSRSRALASLALVLGVATTGIASPAAKPGTKRSPEPEIVAPPRVEPVRNASPENVAPRPRTSLRAGPEPARPRPVARARAREGTDDDELPVIPMPGAELRSRAREDGTLFPSLALAGALALLVLMLGRVPRRGGPSRIDPAAG